MELPEIESMQHENNNQGIDEEPSPEVLKINLMDVYSLEHRQSPMAIAEEERSMTPVIKNEQ